MIPRKLLSVLLSVLVMIAMTFTMVAPLSAYAQDEPEPAVTEMEGPAADAGETPAIDAEEAPAIDAEEVPAVEAEEAPADGAGTAAEEEETVAAPPASDDPAEAPAKIAKGAKAAAPAADPVAKIGDTEYSSLQTAFNNAPHNAVIVLLKDTNARVTVTSGGALGLDLNGHTLSSSGCTITIDGDSLSLTVNNGTVSTTGTGESDHAAHVKNGTLIVSDATFTSAVTTVRGTGDAIIIVSGTVEATGNRPAIVAEETSVFSLPRDGAVKNTNSDGTTLGAVRLSSTKHAEIKGTVTTAGGTGPAVIVSNGSLKVEDTAEIIAGGRGPALQAGGINGKKGTITVSDGRITSFGGPSVTVGTSDSTFTINGGKFSDDVGNGDAYTRPNCRHLEAITDGDYAGYYELGAEEHNWDTEAVEIGWNEDNTQCTATVYCKNDPTHKLTETVTPTSEVMKKPTCTEWGWTTYTADFTNEILKAAVGEDNTVSQEDVEPTGHDWDTEAVEIEWNADNTQCTATVYCKNDPSHELTETVKPVASVSKEPTTTEWGWTTYTANFTNEILKAAVGEDNTVSQEDIEPITYKVVEGGGQAWVKGSGVSADFHIERSYKDEETYSLFTGIQVDGKTVPATEYKTEEGSVIIKIQPAYLETLSAGKHTLTAQFKDADVDTTFTIKEGGAKTGDDADLGLFTLAMLTSLGALCGIAALKRRSE